MNRKALIVWGGWPGHQPRETAELFRDILMRENFGVEVSDTLDAFADEARLRALDLIIPIWTMGKIEKHQLDPVLAAVRSGVGMAGCHGGMCDSFRETTEWQFMTGAQWVAHPGDNGVKYTVHIAMPDHPITHGIADFSLVSEQYYLHVDPAVKVLASTRFPIADGPHMLNDPVDMPVAFTKMYGHGRIFYNSLGHQIEVLKMPQVTELMRRGFIWAAEGKARAGR